MKSYLWEDSFQTLFKFIIRVRVKGEVVNTKEFQQAAMELLL